MVAVRYRAHLEQVRRVLAERDSFSTIDVDYADVLCRPFELAERIARFAGGGLDVGGMAAVVDPALHHNRTVRPEAHAE
jgi:hypothetical protein